eukprot:9340102-Pyramimonas_sp.AAC.1
MHGAVWQGLHARQPPCAWHWIGYCSKYGLPERSLKSLSAKTSGWWVQLHMLRPCPAPLTSV